MTQNMLTHLAMRGCAALLVLSYHYSQLLVPELGFGNALNMLRGLVWFIDAFFVLSGFIMGSLYAERLADGGLSAWHYLRGRFARIYPLHFATMIWMIVVLLLLGSGVGELAVPALRQLFLVHGWGLTDAYHLNHPTWSISGELAAYLVFPAIAGMVLRDGLGRSLLAAVALVFICTFVWLTEFQGIAPERLTLLRALAGFFVGLVLSRLKHHSSSIGATSLAALQVGALALLFAAMFSGATLLATLPLLAAIIFLSWDDRGPLAWALCRPTLLQLGVWSYGIYMLHIPVVFTGFLLWGRFFGSMTDAGDVAVFLGLCTCTTVVLAWASHRYFEMPLRNMLRPARQPNPS